jgi:hypothetical protein
MTLEQEKIHQVVELADSALHWVERLCVRRRVPEIDHLSHREGTQVIFQFSHVARHAMVVGEAGVAIREDGTQFHVEGGPNKGLAVLEHTDELGTRFVLHRPHPNIPGATIHENGGAHVAVHVRWKVPGKVEAGVDPGDRKGRVGESGFAAYGRAVRRRARRSPGHEAGQFARTELRDTARCALQGAEHGFALYPKLTMQGDAAENRPMHEPRRSRGGACEYSKHAGIGKN